jgi:hypothetical protein
MLTRLSSDIITSKLWILNTEYCTQLSKPMECKVCTRLDGDDDISTHLQKESTRTYHLKRTGLEVSGKGNIFQVLGERGRTAHVLVLVWKEATAAMAALVYFYT